MANGMLFAAVCVGATGLDVSLAGAAGAAGFRCITCWAAGAAGLDASLAGAAGASTEIELVKLQHACTNQRTCNRVRSEPKYPSSLAVTSSNFKSEAAVPIVLTEMTGVFGADIEALAELRLQVQKSLAAVGCYISHRLSHWFLQISTNDIKAFFTFNITFNDCTKCFTLKIFFFQWLQHKLIYHLLLMQR